MSPDPAGGMTRFLRCATCYALYEPAVGLHLESGQIVAYWSRPRPRRGTRPGTLYERAIPCDHRGAIEQWDGQDWIPAPVRETRTNERSTE